MKSPESQFTTAAPAVFDALREFDSATVQNALIFVRGYAPAEHDYSGPELRCMLPSMGPVVGYAMTACKTALHPLETSLSKDAYFDSIFETDVPIIAVIQDVDDPPNRAAMFGDEMAHLLAAIGCVGAVIGGCVRDLEGTERAGVGLWATGVVPGHGPDAFLRHGVPVTIAGLQILPGDILVCDANGVTRVPVDIAADVAVLAAKVKAKEASIFKDFTQPDFTREMWESWKDSHEGGAWPKGAKPEIPK